MNGSAAAAGALRWVFAIPHYDPARRLQERCRSIQIDVQCLEGGCEAGRQSSLELARRETRGFGQGQAPRVQEKMRGIEDRLQTRIFHAAVTGPAVQVVSHNPIAGSSQVNPQLVGPSGLRLMFHQGNVPAAGHRAVTANIWRETHGSAGSRSDMIVFL
jgi:hypothetical protein